MLKDKKLLPKIIIIAVVTIAAIIVAIVLISKNSKSSKVNKLMQTANEYLTNLDYVSAIASYKAAIEIDPKNEEAYLGLADAYVGLEDYDSAIDVLNDGLAELPDNEEIKNRIEEIQAIIDKKAAEEEPEISDKEQETSDEDDSSKDTDELENAKWVKIKETHFNGNYIVYEYDVNGNNTKETNYRSDGSIIVENEYEYDENGNKVSSAVPPEYWDNYYKLIIYEYGEMGNIIKITRYDTDDSVNRYLTYEYDEMGNVIQKITYDKDDSVVEYETYEYETYEYTYNTLGLISTKHHYFYCSSAKEVTSNTYRPVESESFIKYEYDEMGTMIREILCDSTWTEYGSYDYEYDEYGNPITAVFNDYDDHDSFIDQDWEYDEHGNNIKYTSYYGDGSVSYCYIYEYDEYGNKIKETKYDSDGSIYSTTTYEYELIQIAE